MKFELDISFSRLTKEFIAEGKVNGLVLKPGIARSAQEAVTLALTRPDNKEIVNLKGCDELLNTPGKALGVDNAAHDTPKEKRSDALSEFIHDGVRLRVDGRTVPYTSSLVALSEACREPKKK